MSDPDLPLTGGCMCGAVHLEISEPLLGALYCHCTRCQRRTGTGFSVSGLAAPGSFRITAGEELVCSWDPGDGGWTKAFCSRCGSQLFAASSENPSQVAVRLGTIDGDPGVRPSAHQFTAYAPAWSPVPDDGLPHFSERLATDATPPETGA